MRTLILPVRSLHIVALASALLALTLPGASLHAERLPASKGAPQLGQKAPEFTLPDTSGKPVTLSELLAASTAQGSERPWLLLIFYRGYWCHYCISELRSFQQDLAPLSTRGVRVVAISVDSPKESRSLADKQGYGFPILSDEKRQVIRAYDLMDPRAGIPPFGSVTPSDIARPAEFLLDRDGVVRWRNLSDNYKTRATPTIVLKALDELASSAGTEKK